MEEGMWMNACQIPLLAFSARRIPTARAQRHRSSVAARLSDRIRPVVSESCGRC